MNKHSYEWHTFPNQGFLTAKFSKEDLAPLYNEVREIEKDFNNAKDASNVLVGNVKKEYHLSSSRKFIDGVVYPLCLEYEKIFKYSKELFLLGDQPPYVLELKDAWVNFQENGEFQPSHSHSGLFSFVFWLQIPFNLEDENKLYSDKTNDCSQFGFNYTDALGKLQHHHLHLDKVDEGLLAVFPAQMEHYVYPFYTSDNYRITVAGNYGIKEFINQ